MITEILALIPLLTSWESCALNIIQKHRPSAVYFLCSSPEQCPTNNFYSTMRTPSQTLFGLDIRDLPRLEETDLVFMLIHNGEDAWNNDTTQKYRHGGNNEFMLVVVANMTDSTFMETFFASMWESGIVKCAVLLTNETSNELFTYIPFQDSAVCENTSPVFLGECSSAANNVFDLTYKVKNLNKCPLRIAIADDRPWLLSEPFTGRLVHLVNELEKRMNFSVIRMNNGNTGGICGAQELTGSRGDVAYGRAHMAFGSYGVRECSSLKYIGVPITYCMTWCTPLLPESRFVYSFIVRQFEFKVWIALILSVFLVVLCVLLLCYATNERYTANDIINLALTLYAQVPPQDFRTTPVRVVVAFWLLTCLVVQTAYLAEFKSQSSVPLGSRIIHSMEEMLQTELQLCSIPENLQVFGSFKEPLLQRVYSKMKVCDGSLFINLIAAANLKDRAVFTTELRCRVALSGNSGSLFAGTGGCIKLIPFVVIVTLPGSPFKEVFQQFVNRCFDAGLVYKWIDLQEVRRESGHVRALSLSNLLPALFILGIGCIAAFVSLLIEIAVSVSLCTSLRNKCGMKHKQV